MPGHSNLLKEFAVGVRVSAAMQGRLTLMHERLTAVQQENDALKTRCAELEQRCDELQRESSTEMESELFVDRRGAKFRRLPDGTFDRQVYCPKCRKPMTTPAEDFLPYRCAPCHYLSPLKGFDFPAVLDELQAPALHDA